jgi:hypothetical protein
MKTTFNLLAFLALLVLAWEWLQVAVIRQNRRSLIWAQANERKNQTNKKLIVIGDPDADNFAFDGLRDMLQGGDWRTYAYGYGDVCIDINGCPQVADKPGRSIKADLKDVLPTLATNSAVIFISCVLEYVDDLPTIAAELERISGGDLFIVNMEPHSLKTRYAPNLGYSFPRKWRIINAPPNGRLQFVKI